MRHGASLLASLEGMSRTTYRIARELANNSRSGLTVRFLSKKLDIPEEEIEYLLDVNHRLMFTDLTKIKLVPEGHSALKRIGDGLENHGDIPSLVNRVKSLEPHDFRRLEERLGVDQPLSKKAAAELMIEKYYKHPDSILNYVATRGFSSRAREVFDILWQSRDGVMPVSQIRAAQGGSEYEVEQALWELSQGFATFEMFRFDGEDRLVRVQGLLSEIRQYRKSAEYSSGGAGARLKTVRSHVDGVERRELGVSDTLCRLVALISARPARLRSDGELFREDRRRLEDVCGDEEEPSLNTCLWIASGLGWLNTVDAALVAADISPIIGMSRIARHRLVHDWLMARPDEAAPRKMLESVLEEMRPDTWYPLTEFIAYAMGKNKSQARPVLKAAGAHYEYMGPSMSGRGENRLARMLEESLFWLGAVERGTAEGDTCFRISPIGQVLLCGAPDASISEKYPERRSEIVVQPNFDIVAPVQDMDPLLTVPLDQFAVRMSMGKVAVYSLNKESFLQAIQNGQNAQVFMEYLISHNRGGTLPSNVLATLEDWGGAVKRVRLRTYHVIESDDPLVMADLAHRRKLGRYLEPLDPHKVTRYTETTKAEMEKMLEKEGFIVE